MAAIIPDPYRRWVNGTAYDSCADEYTQDGTCVGIGTLEIVAYGRACGVTYASPVTFNVSRKDFIDDLFSEMFGG